jgi:hypothetical protein
MTSKRSRSKMTNKCRTEKRGTSSTCANNS